MPCGVAGQLVTCCVCHQHCSLIRVTVYSVCYASHMVDGFNTESVLHLSFIF